MEKNESMRIEEFENENAVTEYNCESEPEKGNGLLGVVLIGICTAGAAIGGYLYATRDKRKAKKLEKAKKLVKDSGYDIFVAASEVVVESDSEAEKTDETEE